MRFTNFLCLLTFLAVGTTSLLLAADKAPVGQFSPFAADIEGSLIDTIVIENRNIYDTSDPEYKNFLFRTANRLHIRTRQKIVAQELLLKVGDPYSQILADESARNLRARLALFDAIVAPQRMSDGRLLVRVITIDQWSLSGGIQYSREGNRTEYQIGGTEKNLLGRNQYFLLKYFWKEEETDYFQVRFVERRLIGSQYRLMLDYNDNPLDKIRRVDFRRPFLSISQRLAFRLGRSSVSGRDDIYSDDRRIAQSWFDGDAAAVGLSYRVGPYDKKLSVNLNYDYRHRRNLDRELLTGDPNEIIIAQNGFPIDSLYHRLGCGVSLARTEFITTKRIDGFSYTEDIVLGSSVGIAFQRAIHPDSLLYNSIKAGFDYRTRLGEGLMMFSTRGATDYRGSISYSRRSRTSLRYFYQPTDYMTLAARTVYINDWRFDGSEGLNLGGTSGIRGYDEYFRSGDRLAVTNLETRFYPDLEILSVLIGGAAFVDIGRTWKPDESFRVRDFHMAIGAGLRISFEKASKSSLVRLDVAYSDENRWQLSIGTGQYFGSGAQEMILTNF